jgi:intracellular sulfur oxidation DsrE/DsrF family protein
MKNLPLPPTPRRNFLQNLAAGSAALVAGSWATAQTAQAKATPRSSPVATVADDDWLDRIHGTHRQIFDIVEPNSGLGAAYAMNYLTSFQEAHDISDDDICAVTVFRHNAYVLTMTDMMWEKYKLGEFFDITDPTTDAPAVRNIFRDNIPLQPGLTYETMVSEKGVIVCACNIALSVYSMLTAPNAGVSAEEAKAEWTENILDGIVLVPSGVYAVNRAQEHGCTYCYGG